MATQQDGAAPARWEAYAEASGVEHFAWWCREFVVQSVDDFAGAPLELEEFQLEVMGEAMAVLDEGRPAWRSVVLVVPRKNGKTALLAAYALYRLLHDDGAPEILLAAASSKQAGRLFDGAVGYVRSNPELERLVVVREHEGEIVRIGDVGLRAKIIRVASDAGTVHGFNPSLVICDELHAWTKPLQRKVWAGLTTGGGARRAPQTFTITTAGEAQERELGILGRLVDRNERSGVVERPSDGLTISRQPRSRTLVYNYSAPTTDPADTAAMKLANPASWITEEFLAEQAEKRGHAAIVKPVRGGHEATNLPEGSVDVVFVCDAYHHFEKPGPMLASIHKALRPSGRVVLIDFDKHDKASEFVKGHARAEKEVYFREFTEAGFRRRPSTGLPELKENFVAVFEKVGP